MKIAILSTSAFQGGAAIAASRLADALRTAGHSVELFTMDGVRRERTFPFLAERLEIFCRNGFNRQNLFRVSTGRFGRSSVVEQVLDYHPDTIILGWINQGFLSLKQVSQLASAAPLFWVMHDMWNLTGICHYAHGCNHFTAQCGNCPMISAPMRRPSDLSHCIWLKKKELYAATPIRFLAVSHWLAKEGRRSSLLRDMPVDVLPNVFPMEQFAIGEKEPGLILLGAARLDDPIKGLGHAIGALNRLVGHPTAHVIFFGELRNPQLLADLKLPYRHLGSIPESQVAELMSRAEVVLSSALYETFGLTLLEGQACGAIPVSFDRDGRTDIIDHLHTGYLAPFGDDHALARGIRWALEHPLDPLALRQSVDAKFSAPAIAARFTAIVEQASPPANKHPSVEQAFPQK